MEFFGSERDSRNIRRGKKPDTAATRVTDDDIACDDDAPFGRRQTHLSADDIAFAAVINVEADDLSAVFRDRAAFFFGSFLACALADMYMEKSTILRIQLEQLAQGGD